MPKVVQLNNGIEEARDTINTSAGAGDAGRIPELNASGQIDSSMIPATVGQDTENLEAFEALTAGDFVNIFDDAGTPKVRLADASDISTKANGFVLASYAALATATVYFEGTNDQLSGLTPGVDYYLSITGGQVTATPPSATNEIVQFLGTAKSATKLDVEISRPIKLLAP